jgi:Cell division protein FtsQ/DivIB, C-terminal
LVVAAGAKKKKTKSGSGWSWRLAGIALCAFFALGVLTGLSQSGRLLAQRIEALLRYLPHSSRSALIPAAYRTFFIKQPIVEDFRSPSASSPSEAIALIEHPDGFYEVGNEGGLFGPVSPAQAADIPVISGSGVEHASAVQLLEYAAELIRAEAILAARISEMRVASSGEICLYLDRPHLAVILEPAGWVLQLARASKVLSLWRGHQQLIGIIDMTVPDEAIVRPKIQSLARSEHGLSVDLYGGSS